MIARQACWSDQGNQDQRGRREWRCDRRASHGFAEWLRCRGSTEDGWHEDVYAAGLGSIKALTHRSFSGAG